MNHTWAAYTKYAWGYDEIRPISKKGKLWWSPYRSGATLIDSLDTLWIMGMKDEFKAAVEYVIKNIHFNIVSIFFFLKFDYNCFFIVNFLTNFVMYIISNMSTSSHLMQKTYIYIYSHVIRMLKLMSLKQLYVFWVVFYLHTISLMM